MAIIVADYIRNYHKLENQCQFREDSYYITIYHWKRRKFDKSINRTEKFSCFEQITLIHALEFRLMLA